MAGSKIRVMIETEIFCTVKIENDSEAVGVVKKVMADDEWPCHDVMILGVEDWEPEKDDDDKEDWQLS